jgi:hypothetical protein
MAMSDHHDTLQQEQSRRRLGLPSDLCRPTATRFRARAWNPDDPRILTPKAFGWGLAALLFAATVGVLAPAAPAWAEPATTLQVNPRSVVAGDTVVVSGSVGPAPAGSACATSVMLLSRAFAPTEEFAGVPAVAAAVKPSGTFAATTRIPRSTPAGTYTIGGRCGGENLGTSATLTVRAIPTTPPVTLRVSPQSVTAGDTVTVSGSVGPGQVGSACASSIELLSRAFDDTHEFAGVPAVVAAVRSDGTFAATSRISRSTPAGTYNISGRCGGGNIGVSATLGVRAAPAATTAPAPAPSATAPPATQPTASTADNRADGWIIPGLVALAVVAVAALGVSLLYRRRHPTGPGGSGRAGEV